MLNSFILGSYYSVDSKVHNLHPVTKIICTLLLIISLVITDSYFYITFSTLLIVLIVYLSKLPLSLFFKSFDKMKYFLLGLLIINIVFCGSIIESFIVILKMILIMTVSSILLFTTTISSMILGLKLILHPLKYIKISPNKISFSLVFAIHFIPILLEQADKVLKSQNSRGLMFKKLNWKEKVKAIKNILIPIFSLSLKKADVVADALEVRHFNYDKKRSDIHMKKIKFLDIVWIIIFIVFLLFSII